MSQASPPLKIFLAGARSQAQQAGGVPGQAQCMLFHLLLIFEAVPLHSFPAADAAGPQQVCDS